MRKENILLIFLLSAVFLIFLYPSLGWKLRSLMADAPENGTDAKNLMLENQALKTDIAKLGILKNESVPRTDFLQASVYSNYPLNFKNELLLDKGEKDGIRKGQAVVIFAGSFEKPVFIGVIKEIFPDNSLAETVFDSGFQMSVKVGGSGVNSLLKGGNIPKLTLIPKDSKVNDGDAVYSTGTAYPFGLSVGFAKNQSLSQDQFFMEADLATAYNPSELRTVSVYISSDAKNINR